MGVCTDIQDAQTMYPHDFGDPPTVPHSATVRLTFVVLSETQQLSITIRWIAMECEYLCSPQDEL